MLYEESKMYLLVHCTMLGTFPKDFFKGATSQVTTSLIFNFLSSNFPSLSNLRHSAS